MLGRLSNKIDYASWNYDQLEKYIFPKNKNK